MLPNVLLADDVLGEPKAVSRCIAEIKVEQLCWLWPGRIPLGKLTILSGDPGLGKSLVTLAIAAAVSHGARWPCNEGVAPQAEVVLVSAEDDAADTIRPRLEAARADLNQIHILDAVAFADPDTGECRKRPWNFGDITALGELLEKKPACRLVIVDPIGAYLGGVDSHKNADVRALLAPLAEMAAQRRVAVVCVNHLNKGSGPAIYRSTGSLAFIAAARAAYAVAKDRDDDSRRLMLPVKCNLAPDSSGLAYKIEQADNGSPVVAWDAELVTVAADEALAYQADDEDRGELTGAAEWLQGLLKGGVPMPTESVRKAAHDCGFAWRTVQRAMYNAGVESRRGGFGKPATWVLTNHATRASQPTSPKHGATGVNGATVENIGLAGDTNITVAPVAPSVGDGADGGEL